MGDTTKRIWIDPICGSYTDDDYCETDIEYIHADIAEAEKRAAVAAAYEKAACSLVDWRFHGPVHVVAQADDIRALADTDALAEYVERERAEERERCAKIADEFSWTLPLYGEQKLDEATDDAACSVCEQIAAANRQETNDA
jgi:hypothetical protein